MPRPKRIPPIQLERVRALEERFLKAVSSGDLQKAKLILNDLKPILEEHHHEHRLLENYLRLYEGALEAWNLPIAKRGLESVRSRANKSTRLYLEATTLLAIAHLREGDLFSAEPLMAEVLRNDEVIESEVTRRLFRRETIDRFDQEGALSAYAKVYPEIKSEAEVHAEAVQLLRKGKGEAELLEGLGSETPQSVKDFILKVDRLSKNILPDAERLLLPSPQEIVKDRHAGLICL